MSEKVLVIALLGPPLIMAVLQELRDAIMATDAFKPSERPCSLEIITAEEMRNAIGGASVQPSLPLPVQVSQMRYSVGFPASRDVLDDDERL